MKKRFCLLTTILLAALLHPFCAVGDTQVAPEMSRSGKFTVLTLALTADATGGAVTNQTLDLSEILSNMNIKPLFFYMTKTMPGSGTATPEAYTITFTDDDGGGIRAIPARSTTAQQYDDAAEDLPNYWPVYQNIKMSVSDIGANHATTIKLIFSE